MRRWVSFEARTHNPRERRNLTIANRTRHSAETLATELKSNWPWMKVEVGIATTDHDVIINATSLGMHPNDELPVDITDLSAETAVIDITTSPENSELPRAARATGCATMGGAPILVGQVGALMSYWLDRRAIVEPAVAG